MDTSEQLGEPTKCWVVTQRWTSIPSGVGAELLLVAFKAVLHKATFRATRLATLLRHKLHEKLPSVTYPATEVSRDFFCRLPQPLRKVELDSTFRNDFGNAATIFFVTLLATIRATCLATICAHQPIKTFNCFSRVLVAVTRQVARIIAQRNTPGLVTLQRTI